ncbi:DNA repair rad8 [Fusarium longipes]|uniref:DNA repair rad8 n=1 Tax=Fusarium longipes TaxID=694270 RepID=A0A395RF81_9HYPO|nr:DNA repair rad8 [Fusarium longipes]
MLFTTAPLIPVGCLTIDKEEVCPESQAWSAGDFSGWRSFRSLSSDSGVNDHDIFLPHDLEVKLMKIKRLSPYFNLCQKSWMRLEFNVKNHDSDRGTLRLYLLPDDALRRTIDRSDRSLLRSRDTILGQLNYSKDAWGGNTDAIWLGSPHVYKSTSLTTDQEEGMSLLQLFNNIPSPAPNVELVEDSFTRSVMCNLLNCTVPGLKSDLYPYQRRSAALMLQKEVQPEQVLDPRLLEIQDQEGEAWYLDPVAREVLKDPRYYDGVCGGILAEEMGSGKTIICLALILATKDLPTQPPEHFRAGYGPTRKSLASLAEMAASCATRNSVPWRPWFNLCKAQSGNEYTRCVEALEMNPGYYFIPPPEPRRTARLSTGLVDLPKKRIYLSNGSLVVVPSNLLAQWKQEISKHTEGMEVLVMEGDKQLPAPRDLLKYDMILFPQSRLEALKRQGGMDKSPLSQVHFKRCIVDEGHKLGNSKISGKSNMLLVLDSLNFSSRWIVTGTPSHGLYGVDTQKKAKKSNGVRHEDIDVTETHANQCSSDIEMETKDLIKIGAIAALYLKARPWANTSQEAWDTTADWTTYLLLPKHKSTGRGRWDILRSTLNSLIIRHRLTEVGDLLPPVNERLVILEGSYQDQMCLNIFSMMIIFNTVQSQRTDMDYFFHAKQRKALMQIVQNLKQASFFGGSFYSQDDIIKAVETAEGFLQEEKVPINNEDRCLLEQAIQFGHVVTGNKLKALSNQFHEMPVYVKGMPQSFSTSWSLDGDTGDGMCSSSNMLVALQKLIYKSASKPDQFNSLLNGQLAQEGIEERERMLASNDLEKSSQTLAGNTKLGDDQHPSIRSRSMKDVKNEAETVLDGALGPLEEARITSTTSAKLSYLIDSILRHQDYEKILIFYENDNVAWYLAGMLEVLQIQHLIYAKGLAVKRRAQYVNTFNHNPRFRVLLMDISQAAFGLDMREASRIYFISPVLNPQIEAQAIGRARRISQKKAVFVETLVLKNSIEEVILERKQHMTQAEHRQVQSILDVGPIYNWIKNARINPMPMVGGEVSKESQMAPLETPQYIFRRGFGRIMHPDEGLVLDDSPTRNINDASMALRSLEVTSGLKRTSQFDKLTLDEHQNEGEASSSNTSDVAARSSKRVRFAGGSEED